MDSILSKQTLNKYIIYINDNINELKLNHRKEVLQIIIGSDIEDEKIVEKGNGTQVRYVDIDGLLLKKIYNYMFNKLELSHDVI